MSGCRDTNWPRSRWRKWKTARRAATDRFLPSARRGSGIAASSARKGSNDLKATSESIRSPQTDSDFFTQRNRPLHLPRQDLQSCCIRDSVESVEQPWFALGGFPDDSMHVSARRAMLWVSMTWAANKRDAGENSGHRG